MSDRLFERVPWWAAAVAIHVVVLVQLMAVGRGPRSEMKGDPEAGELNVRLQAAGPSAIQAALDWLARHQDADGGWSARGYTRHCTKPCRPDPGEGAANDTGVSALAVLAFLEGDVPLHEPSRLSDALRRGLGALVARQDVEGAIGPRTDSKSMIGHLIATRALCLAVRRGAAGFGDAARAAVDFALAARNPGKGWRYSTKCGDNDSLVTAFALLALREAKRAGFFVPSSAWDGARACLDEVTQEHFPPVSHVHIGYRVSGVKMLGVPGVQSLDHPATTAALGVLARRILEGTEEAGPYRCDFLPERGGGVDSVSGYLSALAFREPIGPILPPQNLAPGTCLQGSWEPVDPWSPEGGRVYATAMNALTLAARAKR